MGILDLFGKAKEIGDGVSSITDSIGDKVSKVISTVKDKVPPEMRGEIEKLEIETGLETLKLKAETETKIKELLQKSEESFRDFVLKYEGTASQVPKGILIFRSLIRPVITTFMFASFMFFCSVDMLTVLKKTGEDLILTSLPDAYWIIFGIVIGFWFGGKIGENIVDKIKGN